MLRTILLLLAFVVLIAAILFWLGILHWPGGNQPVEVRPAEVRMETREVQVPVIATPGAEEAAPAQPAPANGAQPAPAN